PLDELIETTAYDGIKPPISWSEISFVRVMVLLTRSTGLDRSKCTASSGSASRADLLPACTVVRCAANRTAIRVSRVVQEAIHIPATLTFRRLSWRSANGSTRVTTSGLTTR